MEIEKIAFAFGLTLFAGLSTGIGGALAFFTKQTNTKFMSVALGFSAGIMIYISLTEIFYKAREALILDLGEIKGGWLTIISFFTGMGIIALIDKLVPSSKNPHEPRKIEEITQKIPNPKKLYRMGIFTALAITIHNFPEGLATFIAGLQGPEIGIPIAIAIAIHNIPEGIAVSIPIYYATGSRKKAFLYSFLSGLAEPLGALVGFLVLMPILSNVVLGVVFAGVGGIMVFISLDELLPAAREYGEHHLSIYGLVAGMIIIAISIQLLG